PQIPQCFGSVAVSTHSLPHGVASVGQTHFPAWQYAHLLPQAPQFTGSRVVSTHLPAQRTEGIGQPPPPPAPAPVLVASFTLEPHAPIASSAPAIARRSEENRSFMSSTRLLFDGDRKR